MPAIQFVEKYASGGRFFKKGDTVDYLHPILAERLIREGTAIPMHASKASSAHAHPPAEEASLDSDPPKRKRGRPRKDET